MSSEKCDILNIIYYIWYNYNLKKVDRSQFSHIGIHYIKNEKNNLKYYIRKLNVLGLL